MLKALKYLFLVGFVILAACKHQDAVGAKLEPSRKRTDLSKAATYNMQLGLGYLKQGDRPRAKKKLLIALSQAPDSPDTNTAFAYYFEQTKETDQAKKYYLKALSLSSNAGAQLNNYGAFLCRQGDYKKAEDYFLKAVKDIHYINTSGAYENAGLCSVAVPDYDKARLYFTSALNQDPSRKESLYELVKLETKQGNDDEALKLLDKYPDLVSSDTVLIDLAKEIASKVQNVAIAAKYDNDSNFSNIQSVTDKSGVNNEYNNHNG